MPSARGFTTRAFQCSLYEAQDVLLDTGEVHLVCPQPRSPVRFRARERWQHRLLYRDISRRLVFVNPGLEPVTLDQDYELFVAVCQNYWDLLYINAIQGWKERCKTSILWLDEFWAADIPHCRYWLHALNQFDHVFLGYHGSVAALSRAIGRPCHWIGAGVDALRFSPYPYAATRSIDIYSVGRGSEAVHRSILSESAHRGWFYVYDTLRAADMEAFDHRAHRSMLANIAKRSRYFLVAPAKMNLPDETAGQIEVGYRYYEGAAAGAVLIGQSADCPPFRERFDWPDAVIELRPDGSDAVDIINDLNRQPERLCEMSRRNTAQSLLRHDWAYRWQEIFEVAGVLPPASLATRERQLRDLAGQAARPDR